jgi:hypothetical protein
MNKYWKRQGDHVDACAQAFVFEVPFVCQKWQAHARAKLILA